MKNKLSIWLARGLTGLRALGPYAIIELIVPGGTVIAVLLWLYRRRTRVEVNTSVSRAASSLPLVEGHAGAHS